MKLFSINNVKDLTKIGFSFLLLIGCGGITVPEELIGSENTALTNSIQNNSSSPEIGSNISNNDLSNILNQIDANSNRGTSKQAFFQFLASLGPIVMLCIQNLPTIAMTVQRTVQSAIGAILLPFMWAESSGGAPATVGAKVAEQAIKQAINQVKALIIQQFKKYLEDAKI